MVLGLSPAAYTQLHTIISLIAIAGGLRSWRSKKSHQRRYWLITPGSRA